MKYLTENHIRVFPESRVLDALVSHFVFEKGVFHVGGDFSFINDGGGASNLPLFSGPEGRGEAYKILEWMRANGWRVMLHYPPAKDGVIPDTYLACSQDDGFTGDCGDFIESSGDNRGVALCRVALLIKMISLCDGNQNGFLEIPQELRNDVSKIFS